MVFCVFVVVVVCVFDACLFPYFLFLGGCVCVLLRVRVHACFLRGLWFCVMLFACVCVVVCAFMFFLLYIWLMCFVLFVMLFAFCVLFIYFLCVLFPLLFFVCVCCPPPVVAAFAFVVLCFLFVL